jgi:hypothetical protein
MICFTGFEQFYRKLFDRKTFDRKLLYQIGHLTESSFDRDGHLTETSFD